jgi:hypothetical protein
MNAKEQVKKAVLSTIFAVTAVIATIAVIYM